MEESNSESAQTEGSDEEVVREVDCRNSDEQERCLRGGSCALPPENSISISDIDAVEPRVGMIFESEETAYDLYDDFARTAGFNVRKSKVQRRSDGAVVKRYFVCSKEGCKERHPRTGLGKTTVKERDNTRTDCMAHLVLKHNDDGKWIIVEYVCDHNHPLSNRLATPSEGNASASVDDGGIRPADGFNYTKGATPQIGMVFKSEESAYEFYKAYARKVGFTLRKGKLSRQRSGAPCGRLITCSSEGLRHKDPRTLGKRRGRPPTRTNCKACLVLKVKANTEWPWVVSDIVYGHNHSLGSQSNANKVKPCSNIDGIEGDVVQKSMPTSLEPNHGNKCVNETDPMDYDLALFDENYSKNSLPTRRTKYLKKGEMQFLLDYLKKMKLANPSFFYSIQTDKDDQMTNFFWVDARQVIDYSHFGDIVCFDTTYRTNVYNLPVTPFLGVNHHKQFVLFGIALLLDESMNSFVWLFETWLKAVHRRQPKAILIDQWDNVEKAVSMVMQKTHQVSCLWHMLQNSIKNLSHVYDKNPDFGNVFKNCIYQDGSAEAFNSEWNGMLKNYHLMANKWLRELYEVHDKWALINGRKIFTGGLRTVQYTDSIKTFFTNVLRRNVPLTEFLTFYEKVLISMYEEEMQEDVNDRQTEPQLLSEMEILKQASKEYTRKVFGLFQEEFENSMCCNAEVYDVKMTVHKYKVFQFGQCKEFFVSFDTCDGIIVCSCMKFESEGLLCSHALKVLNLRDIVELPPQYILKRWKRNAKSYAAENYHANEWQTASSEKPMSLRFTELCHKAFTIAAKATASKKTLAFARSKLEDVFEEVEAVWKVEIAEKSQKIALHFSDMDHADNVDHGNNVLNLSDSLIIERTLGDFRNEHNSNGVANPHHPQHGKGK